MRRLLVFLAVLVLALAFVYCEEAVDNYYYNQLSSSEQVAYQAMFDCITTLVEKWNCGSISQETLKKSYDCLILDHPELFWTNSFTYVTSYVNNVISGHYVEFDYTLTRSEIEQKNKEIEQAVIEIVQSTGTIEPSYETVRRIYVWMVENCQYDKNNMDQSLYSVLVKRSGVCASFSKAFEFILQCLGIPCVAVNGKLKQGSGLLGLSNLGHEWNLVKINGSWTFVDITSAISLYESTGSLNYDYFCCTTEFLQNTHLIDNVVAIPVCEDESLSIFKYYGLELSEYNVDSSLEAIKNAFVQSAKLGMLPTVRFSNYRAFYDAKTDLISNAKLFDVVSLLTGETVKTLNYTLDENLLSISVII